VGNGGGLRGPIALVGAGEFLPTMAEVDQALLAAVGRAQPRVAVVPTAAAQEGQASMERWAAMGLAHFRALGAVPEAVYVADRADAEDPSLCRALVAADLVYFSGGDPAYLVQTLAASAAWAAVAAAHEAGGALAGCSAGAMALAAATLDFRASRDGPPRWLPGWGAAPGLAVLPHFDRLQRSRSAWVAALVAAAPAGISVVGIDEHTVLVDLGAGWRVMGQGAVSVLAGAGRQVYRAGEAPGLLGAPDETPNTWCEPAGSPGVDDEPWNT